MIPFGFNPEARLEFRESARYYESQQRGLGHRYVDAVRDAITRIRSHTLSFIAKLSQVFDNVASLDFHTESSTGSGIQPLKSWP